jgi:hypothetical protein
MVEVAALAARAAGPARSHEHRDLALHQVVRQRRQPVEAALGPTVVDLDIAPRHEAGLGQPFAEGRCQMFERLRRRTVQEPDHRHG